MSTMTPAIAMQKFIVDGAKRAGHTLWQTFSASLLLLLGTSALDVAQVDDIATLRKVVLSLAAAVLAAFLSAVKTTVASFSDAKYQPLADAPAVTDDDEAARAALEADPDAELPDEPQDPDQPAAGVPPSSPHVPEHARPTPEGA
jgi:hypothetical protein